MCAMVMEFVQIAFRAVQAYTRKMDNIPSPKPRVLDYEIGLTILVEEYGDRLSNLLDVVKR